MNDKIIIKNKIASSFQNDVYIVEIGGLIYIMKKSPITDTNPKNYSISLWRELDMSLFINKLPKDKIKFFMKTIDFRIIKCKGVYQDYFDQKMIKKKTNKCLQIIYEYKGNTLNSLLLKQNMKLKEKYSMIIQIIYALDILKKGGYIHNDMHSGNITFNKTDKKIKIGTKLIQSNNIYSLIDYGFNKHKKYKINDQYTKEYININWDLLYFTRQIILQNNVLQDLYLEKKFIKDFKPSSKMEYLFSIYDNHKSIWNKIKKTLSKKGKNYIQWFQIFESRKIESFYHNFEDDYPSIKMNGKNIINISIPVEINILFSAYNRKKWIKLNNWEKINVGNFIPSKDIEYLVLNITNNKKLINYFYKKLISD